MILSSAELAAAKDAAGAVLDELGLKAYVYEVEPQEREWRIRVDCATAEGWQSLSLSVDKQTLLASRTDAAIRSHLTGMFCKRLGSGRSGDDADS